MCLILSYLSRAQFCPCVWNVDLCSIFAFFILCSVLLVGHWEDHPSCKTEWRDTGMVWRADGLRMMPLPFCLTRASLKSTMVMICFCGATCKLPQVVLEWRPFNRCCFGFFFICNSVLIFTVVAALNAHAACRSLHWYRHAVFWSELQGVLAG